MFLQPNRTDYIDTFSYIVTSAKTLFEPRGFYRFRTTKQNMVFYDREKKAKKKNNNTGWSCAIQSTECLLKDLER